MSSFLEKFDEKTDGIESEESVLEEDTSYLEKQKKKKKKTILISVILILIILLYFLLSSLITVPNFVNGLSSVATKWGTNHKITIKIEETYDNKVEEGFVISQSISSGKKIRKNQTLTIVVSKGFDPNEKIKVPDLKAMTAEEIKEWKEKEDLSNVTIQEEYSNTVSKGEVISYEFDSVTVNENNFTRNDSLMIIVSKGIESISMEDFTNKTKEDIQKWCLEKGIKYEFKEVFHDTITSGQMVSQSIQSGETIEKNSVVTFEISKGVGIKIPNYFSYSSEEASSINPSIKVQIKQAYHMSVSYGKLISQSLPAGVMKSESDAEITLIYSLGIPYFASLKGTNESELAKIFYEYNQKGVQFTYHITYVNSSEEKGTIISSSKSNEFVSMKEHIEIQVSNGIEA